MLDLDTALTELAELMASGSVSLEQLQDPVARRDLAAKGHFSKLKLLEYQ